MNLSWWTKLQTIKNKIREPTVRGLIVDTEWIYFMIELTKNEG